MVNMFHVLHCWLTLIVFHTYHEVYIFVVAIDGFQKSDCLLKIS